MIFNRLLKMDSAVESVPDEGEISTFATNGNWVASQSANNPSNSTLLFIAVEYVKDNSTADYKFETDSSFSPQPSTYSSEFDQHVSPLDPNMSSTARYSPVYSEEPVSATSSTSTGYSTPVVVPLMSTELEGPAPATGDSCFQDIADADTQLLRQVVGSRYLQMVAASGQIGGVDGEETAAGIPIDYNQRSPEVDEQMMNKELQLVQFPLNNYQQQLSMVERNLKVDPDQVELLITDQNTGISYSYVSQDFLVSRTPLPSLPEDEQQLNNVLNTLESHGLVMETNDDGDISEVTAQNSGLTISDGQMMLQDPLLDSDLLLQAPVEITLDDNVLSASSTLVLKPELSTSDQLIPPEVLSASPSVAEQDTSDVMSEKFSMVNVKEEHLDFDEASVKTEFEAQQLRRSRRQNDRQTLDEDTHLLNRVQSISDKPVPSRARATLPATYLVINKLASSPADSEPEYGVFARKAIPKRTQFGPLEGVLDTTLATQIEITDTNSNELKLLLESETGSMHKLDISDENSSNWMRFVRRAKNFNEQNLVLSQQGYSLYFTTTRAILPRQELQVGYSALYAAKRKLPTLQPTPEDENTWPCFECSLRFTSSDELQKHLNIHDENKQDETIKHRVKKIGRLKRRPIDCPHCSRTFLRRQSLSRHLLQHNNPSAFRERQVRYIRRFNISTDVIDKTLEWKCDICNLYFPTPSLLNLHELIHKNEHSETITGLPLDLGSGCNEGEFLVHSGAVQCPQCGIEYNSRKSLIEHVSDHGKKQPNDCSALAEELPKKGFKCYMCYKAFASRDRLQRHMLVHGSEDSKPLKCDTCSKRFLNNSALSCHLKTHKLDKKIFECPICKISFDQILLLKEHVRCHCIDGVYTCPHCSKVFKEYCIIRKHIRAFHCERKHGCQYCGKPFPTLDKLRMHLLKHSDHREFLCSECGKQFKRKDKLKEHMKRMHAADREPAKFSNSNKTKNNSGSSNGSSVKKFMPKVQPTDYHRFIYKCHSCLLGFKRRGMLVNHLAKRHPDISPESVPELNLPILKTTRDYYCQYCDKVYKSSSKRKAHILKNHPGLELPMSNRRKGGFPDIPGVPNPTFSQTVGSVTTNPHSCQWCHKQYASKAKLLQHQRKKHQDMLPSTQKQPRQATKMVTQQMMMQQQPQSPGIPEEGKFMNSPDVPDSAVGSTVLADDVQEVSEEQLNAFTSNGYIHCDDEKVALTANNIKQTYKLAEESLLNQAVEDFEDCRGTNGQYYRLIQMSGQLIGQSEETVDDPPEPSRLYRLLTANGPFPPYPPR